MLETGNGICLSDFLISMDMTNGCILAFTELFNHYFALEKPRTEYIVLWGIGRDSLKPQELEFQIMRHLPVVLEDSKCLPPVSGFRKEPLSHTQSYTNT